MASHQDTSDTGSLAIFSRASQMLAEADTIQKAKELKSLALTAADWARRKGMGEEAIQHCRSYALDAERKMGQMLAATERAKGTDKAGKTRIDGTRKVPSIAPLTLADIGISKNESSLAQSLAEMPSEKFDEIKTGKVTKARAIKAVRKLKSKAEQVRKIKAYAPPEGKFSVIVADPPWSYSARAEDDTHRAANPYPSMTIKQIIDMPLADNALDDSILWLWTTNAFMVEAHTVAHSWGFQVKTILTWAKNRMGLGDWLRGQTEHCLMCVKGKPVVTLTNQTTLLNGPMRQHSRKPDEFYAMVETLCPGSKCEFFSREKRKGWTTFGAEAGTIR